MGDQVLSRAFELAKEGLREADEGKVESARDKLKAAVSAFEACLRMPGFVQDPRSRALIESEVKELKARRESLVAVKASTVVLEQRMERLQNPHHQDNLQERLSALTGMDKPLVPVEQLEARLRALKSDEATADGASQAQASRPKVPAVFANDDWKNGLDPEVVALMEQVRDETFAFD